MTDKVYVVGVGMTKFERPQTKSWDYPDMGREAGSQALKDAGIPYSAVGAVVASYCYGEPTCGQRAAYELGLSGVPIFNVNNNCSSGSTALMLARQLIKSGYDCVMALGFEKMERGLSERYNDKTSPVKNHMGHMEKLGATPGPIRPGMNDMTSDVIKMFAYAAREYMKKYPICTNQDLVDICFKNRKQGEGNPRAATQSTITESAISKRVLCEPITLAMSSLTADGGAGAILCSESFAKRMNLEHKAVEIVAQHMTTDLPSSFGTSFMDLCGYRMAAKAAEKCYEEAGLSASDVDVLEVHDCFSSNELFMYEALQLAEEGQGCHLVRSGVWKHNSNGGNSFYLGRKWVVNPSGGLETKGHPIGATGLAQCAELVWQLRGQAGKRQVPGAKVALQHNFGIGGAAVVTMYRKHAASFVSAAKL